MTTRATPLSPDELSALRECAARFNPQLVYDGALYDEGDVCRLLATITARDETIAGLTAHLETARALPTSENGQKVLNRICGFAVEGKSLDAIAAATDLANMCCREQIALLESAESRLKRMEEALKPFAAAAELCPADDSLVAYTPVINSNYCITMGDLRSASEAISPSEVTK